MRNFKTIGLAAISALALTASIGAASASATALCTKSPEKVGEDLVCRPGTKLTGEQTLVGKVPFWGTFASPLGSITCSSVKLEKVPVKLENNKVKGRVSQQDFLSCTTSLPGCSLDSGRVTNTTEPDFELTYVNPIKKTAAITPAQSLVVGLQCNSSKTVYCGYKGAWEGQMVSEQSLNFSKQLLLGVNGGICPTSFEFTATYIMRYLTVLNEEKEFWIAKE